MSAVGSVLLVAMAVVGVQASRAGVPLSSAYSAVLLSNGDAYFGKLEKLGTDYPVLSDVYYVRNQINNETKATSSVLVRRNTAWHAPDRMILNARNIVLVEPVTPGSTVSNLIEQAHKQ